MFGKTTNQQKRNNIILKAQNAAVEGRTAQQKIKRLISKGRSVNGVNKIRNTTQKSINSMNKHLNSNLFNVEKAPANYNLLSRLRNKQSNVLVSLQPVAITILKNKKQFHKNVKRLQTYESQNLGRRLAKLKA